MEKTKKSTKTTATPAKKTTAKSVTKAEKSKKIEPAVQVVETQSAPQVEVVKLKKEPVAEVVKEQPKKTSINQELNLLIGLFSLITIITFCFAFQGGDVEILGWELVLKAGDYSGVLKGLMILYLVAIFIDCILTIRIDSDNDIINIIQKALYMFTVIINAIVIAVLLSIIKKVGIGLIIFFIISIISAIVKFAKIFAK